MTARVFSALMVRGAAAALDHRATRAVSASAGGLIAWGQYRCPQAAQGGLEDCGRLPPLAATHAQVFILLDVARMRERALARIGNAALAAIADDRFFARRRERAA